MDAQLEQKNRRLLIGLLGLVVGMVGLAYASVPLYDLFCRVTGFGGTTQRAEGFEGVSPVDRQVTVRFDADVNRGLPWHFGPEMRQMTLNLGEPGFVSYEAKNLSARQTVGTAIYNVAPAKAGLYFHKVQCFCFDETALAPGESMDMPVSFYVEPAFQDDPDLAHLDTITLSYTFYRAASQELDGAIDDMIEAAPLPVQSMNDNPSRGTDTHG